MKERNAPAEEEEGPDWPFKAHLPTAAARDRDTEADFYSSYTAAVKHIRSTADLSTAFCYSGRRPNVLSSTFFKLQSPTPPLLLLPGPLLYSFYIRKREKKKRNALTWTRLRLTMIHAARIAFHHINMDCFTAITGSGALLFFLRLVNKQIIDWWWLCVCVLKWTRSFSLSISLFPPIFPPLLFVPLGGH